MKKTIENFKQTDSLKIIKKETLHQIKGGYNRAICISPTNFGGT